MNTITVIAILMAVISTIFMVVSLVCLDRSRVNRRRIAHERSKRHDPELADVIDRVGERDSTR